MEYERHSENDGSLQRWRFASCFFKYLQFKRYMSKKSEQIMCIPPLSKLEEVTLVNLGGKGHVSRYYNILAANSPESACDKLKVWKLDIKEDIDETDWNGARLKAQTQTINTRFKLLQYKWDVYRI